MTYKKKPGNRAKPTKKHPPAQHGGQSKPTHKRRHHIATFTAVEYTHKVLKKAGIKEPSIREIRKALGGGSHSTINKHLIRIRGRIYFRDEEFVVKMGTTRRQSTHTTRHSRPARTTRRSHTKRRSHTTRSIRTSRTTRTTRATRFTDPTL